MFRSTYQSFEEDAGRRAEPPPFRRVAHEANVKPLPGTIVVTCSVCKARYQKRLECEFFQCESCGALVTHAVSDPSHGPTNQISVTVQQAPSPKKKKKKKKKGDRSTSSSDSGSSDSDSRPKKQSSKRRIRALEKDLMAMRSRRDNSVQDIGNSGYPGATPCPEPWNPSWPSSTPVSPAAQSGMPQLMDAWPNSPGAGSCGSWPAAAGQTSQWPSSPSKSSPATSQQISQWPSSSSPSCGSKNPFTGGSQWPATQGNASMSGGSSWGFQPSEVPAQINANPFQGGFGQMPHVTVNVPKEITTMSSDQLMLLAQAKRCVEQAQQQDQQQQKSPLQLQFSKPPDQGSFFSLPTRE